MKRRTYTAAEHDVHYWEAELIPAAARHDAALDALQVTFAELHAIKAKTTAARQRLVESRRMPTSRTVAPNWRSDQSAD